MATCGLLIAVLTGPLVSGAATRPIGSICGIGNLGKDGIGIGAGITGAGITGAGITGKQANWHQASASALAFL
jgi:hypothetical protein